MAVVVGMAHETGGDVRGVRVDPGLSGGDVSARGAVKSGAFRVPSEEEMLAIGAPTMVSFRYLVEEACWAFVLRSRADGQSGGIVQFVQFERAEPAWRCWAAYLANRDADGLWSARPEADYPWEAPEVAPAEAPELLARPAAEIIVRVAQGQERIALAEPMALFGGIVAYALAGLSEEIARTVVWENVFYADRAPSRNAWVQVAGDDPRIVGSLPNAHQRFWEGQIRGDAPDLARLQGVTRALTAVDRQEIALLHAAATRAALDAAVAELRVEPIDHILARLREGVPAARDLRALRSMSVVLDLLEADCGIGPILVVDEKVPETVRQQVLEHVMLSSVEEDADHLGILDDPTSERSLRIASLVARFGGQREPYGRWLADRAKRLSYPHGLALWAATAGYIADRNPGLFPPDVALIAERIVVARSWPEIADLMRPVVDWGVEGDLTRDDTGRHWPTAASARLLIAQMRYGSPAVAEQALRSLAVLTVHAAHTDSWIAVAESLEEALSGSGSRAETDWFVLQSVAMTIGGDPVMAAEPAALQVARGLVGWAAGGRTFAAWLATEATDGNCDPRRADRKKVATASPRSRPLAGAAPAPKVHLTRRAVLLFVLLYLLLFVPAWWVLLCR